MRFLLRWTWRLILLALIALTALQFWFLVHVWYWNSHNPESTAFMRTRLEILQEDDPKARLRHQWVPYQRISVHLKRAVVAAEDAKFATHNGFDWDGIQKAYEKNLREGEIVAGGSTITQQLAKNLFLSGERTVLRKSQEFVIATLLEVFLDKRRLMEIYLNHVEWGEGVFGAQAAARHHFRVEASALGPAAAARLAVMLPAPRRFERLPDSPYMAVRSATIAARMESVEWRR